MAFRINGLRIGDCTAPIERLVKAGADDDNEFTYEVSTTLTVYGSAEECREVVQALRNLKGTEFSIVNPEA